MAKSIRYSLSQLSQLQSDSFLNPCRRPRDVTYVLSTWQQQALLPK
jgi:hypothetical protein